MEVASDPGLVEETTAGKEVEAAPSRQIQMPALPSQDIPFGDQIPALLARAEAGDPVAVCRLVVDINRCSEEKRKIAFNDLMIQSLEARDGPSDELMIATIARQQERLEASGGYCKGFESAALPSPTSLLQATASLTPYQKALLALTRSDGTIQRLHDRFSYSESGLYVYPQFLADNAYRFLQEGFAAGEPLALEGLVLVHSPSNVVSQRGVSLSLPNPKLFVKYMGLMQRLYGDVAIEGEIGMAFSEVRASIPPDQLVLIDKEMDAEYERWVRLSEAKGRGSARAYALKGGERAVCE